MASSPATLLVQQHRWRLVVLLSLSVLINYVDRGNLSIAAPELSRELALPPARLGLLFSAFFWTYALGQIPAGWLIDRFEVKRIYTVAYVLWSVTTLLTGIAHSMSALLVFRLLLGLGESAVYPACSQLLVRSFSEQERGRANSLIDAGAKAGPILGTFLGGLVVAYWGWRMLFVGAGVIGLMWLVPWQLRPSTPSGEGARQLYSGPSMLRILSRPQMAATAVGLFCYGYVWYFLLTWLPAYLVLERHLTVHDMAIFGAIPFLASGVTALICGWLSDRLIARGSGVTRVRKTFVVAGLLLCTFLVPAASVRSVPFTIGLFTIACCGIGLFSSNLWAITQTLAGPFAAGKWSGMQNAAGNLGGAASPLLTGILVSRTHSFYLSFVSSAAAAVIGAVAYGLWLGPIVPLHWEEEGQKY